MSQAKRTSNLSVEFIERCKALNIPVQDEYSVIETELILGQSHAWVRKMITGYRGKGLRAMPLLKARKVSIANDVSAWRVNAESIDDRLQEVLENRRHEADRFANPAKYISEERRPSPTRVINQVSRIAQEAGLSAEELELLKKLAAKLKEVANS